MSFDAGSIAGKLELDTGGFTKGMLQAEGIAELFPEVVTEFLANPLLGVADIAKETTEALKDVFTEVANDAADMELLSEKAGTSIQFFSEWAGIAGTVKVSAEELAMGFKFLQQNAGAALEGQKEQREAFERIGISMEDLNVHLGDTEWLFKAVREHLAAIPDQFERMRDMKDILGRGGSDLIPIFKMTEEQVNSLIETQKKLGDVEDEEGGKAGRAWLQVKQQFNEMIAGIEKEASKPILDELSKHANEIADDMVKVSNVIRGEIDKGFKYLESPDGKKALADIKKDVDDFITDLPTLASDLEAIAAAVWKIRGAFVGWNLGADFGDVLHLLPGAAAGGGGTSAGSQSGNTPPSPATGIGAAAGGAAIGPNPLGEALGGLSLKHMEEMAGAALGGFHFGWGPSSSGGSSSPNTNPPPSPAAPPAGAPPSSSVSPTAIPSVPSPSTTPAGGNASGHQVFTGPVSINLNVSGNASGPEIMKKIKAEMQLQAARLSTLDLVRESTGAA